MAEKPESRTSTAPPEKKQNPGFFSFENLRSLGVLIAIILALRWSVASPYHVPTASMEPTIKVGDRLLAFKLAYNLKVPFTDWKLLEWGSPQRGDIIVFKYPKDPDIDYVKRVVAIAGDELQVVDGNLYINGKVQERSDHNNDRSVLDDIHDNKSDKLLYRENLDGLDHWVMYNIPGKHQLVHDPWPAQGETYKVPEDSVFVIGDNRDNSTDSRFWKQVPLDYVRGKALFVIWSVWSPEDQTLPSFRFYRFGKSLY